MSYAAGRFRPPGHVDGGPAAATQRRTGARGLARPTGRDRPGGDRGPRVVGLVVRDVRGGLHGALVDGEGGDHPEVVLGIRSILPLVDRQAQVGLGGLEHGPLELHGVGRRRAEVRAAAVLFNRPETTYRAQRMPSRIERPFSVLVVVEPSAADLPHPDVRDGCVLEPYLGLNEADRQAIAMRVAETAAVPCDFPAHGRYRSL